MKHLYLKIGNEKIHSDLCWCEQITKWQNKSLEKDGPSGLADYEMYYLDEADEIYCRCPRPLVKRVHSKDFGSAERPPDLEVCVLCGKSLEKKS
jgi:hypothetical protein